MDEAWWAIRRQQEIKKIRKTTNQFFNEIETILGEYENKKETIEFSSKIKEAINNFKKELENTKKQSLLE